ncbi:hypothetical protein [Amycolatopsis sp. cmx-4-68]|uniref:hypothetical protein n=1 Tax=Amycolatopsis sp. cmx-4-68 TaxID=2790938 RepID=UPI00397C7D90
MIRQLIIETSCPGCDGGRATLRPSPLLKSLNCYGLGGPGKKPGKNEAQLCGTFGPLAVLGWLNFETTVEQS